jgi:hypothetical protein
MLQSEMVWLQERAENYIAAAIAVDANPPTPPWTTRIESSPHEIFIDIDFPSQMRQFADVFKLVSKLYTVERVRIWPSKSGNGAHVVVQVAESLDLGTRLALATAMGSDPFRTLFTSVTRADFLFKPHPLQFPCTTEPDRSYKWPESAIDEVPF